MTPNGNAGHEYEALDVPIEPPEEKDFDRDEIPTGAYMGKLIGFRQTETPPWKLIQQQAQKPDKTPDKLQWEWTFELTTDGFEGATLSEWTTRSWHSRAKATAIASALIGVSPLPRGTGLSTSQLIGRPCQVWIVAKEREDGTTRSYIDKVLPMPKRRTAAPTSALDPDALAHQAEDEGPPPLSDAEILERERELAAN